MALSGNVLLYHGGVYVGAVDTADLTASSKTDTLINGPNYFLLTIDAAVYKYTGSDRLPTRGRGVYSWTYPSNSGSFSYVPYLSAIKAV